MAQTEVVIAGGGFAGLACAKALALRGIPVILLERKKAAGIGMHTTGIIVGECAEEFSLPEHLTRRVTDVRLYAPSLRYVDLRSPEYFFLTTDTPGMMRYLSDEAVKAGAVIHYDTSYESGVAENGRINVNNGAFDCRFLIGADGPRSKVADDFKLGQNTEFLLGAEAEYANLQLIDTRTHDTDKDANAFYCFLDQKLAHGYLGWAIPGVGVTQIGLAQRMPKRPDIDAFTARMRGIFDFTQANVVARRGGLIPVGGLVQPFARDNVILLGDSAGIVSPLTAGGIHTALHYGTILGDTIADYIHHGGRHPSEVLARIYPRFYVKQLLRKSYETMAPNWLLNGVLTNPLFRLMAETVFFKKKQLK
jgi:digeranylgeranylglycerophospholipid reductase